MYVFIYVFASFAHSRLVEFIHAASSYGYSFSLLYTILLYNIPQFIHLLLNWWYLVVSNFQLL